MKAVAKTKKRTTNKDPALGIINNITADKIMKDSPHISTTSMEEYEAFIPNFKDRRLDRINIRVTS